MDSLATVLLGLEYNLNPSLHMCQPATLAQSVRAFAWHVEAWVFESQP